MPPGCRPDIAFLHTSPAHVSTFEMLVSQADAEIGVASFVNESLLEDAWVRGPRHADVVRRVHEAVLNLPQRAQRR